MEKNTELFNMTYQALDSKLNLEFITTQMINEADRLKLWQLIEKRFQLAPKNEFNKDELKNEFKTMTIGYNESKSEFLKRLEKKLAVLATHEIIPSPAESAVVLLEGLKSTNLKDPIVQIRSGHEGAYSNWIREGDLKHTLDKALNHIKALPPSRGLWQRTF